MRGANRSTLAIAVIVLAAAALTVGLLLNSESTAQPPQQPVQVQPATPAQPAQPGAPAQQTLPPAPVVEVPVLMQLFNKPLYTGLKQEMAQQPANEEQWKNLSARGLQAAEIANLVALRKGEGPDDPILRGAAEFQRAGMALADAAKAQQWDATVQAYQGLVQRCNNCHQTLAPDEAPQLQP
jgi:hypothetical protein